MDLDDDVPSSAASSPVSSPASSAASSSSFASPLSPSSSSESDTSHASHASDISVASIASEPPTPITASAHKRPRTRGETEKYDNEAKRRCVESADLRHQRGFVESFANSLSPLSEARHLLLSALDHLDAIELFTTLASYELQETLYIVAALELIGVLGPNERSSLRLPVLKAIVCEPTLVHVQVNCICAMLQVGYDGLVALVDVATKDINGM